ncbi:MAG TPA: hypothetical protein VGB99_17425, partial [Acidobacteriota bacterium]
PPPSYSEILARRFDSLGAALGQEFMVNSYTTHFQAYPRVSPDSSGDFVVIWTSYHQDPYFPAGVFGRRFDSIGAPVGMEFRINNLGGQPAVSREPSGGFCVVWERNQQSFQRDVYGRRFDSSGSPIGSEFIINSFTTYEQQYSDISHDSLGNFVVVWQSRGNDGSQWGIFGQRFNTSGARLGSEFQINTYTHTYQIRPEVSHAADGGFVVTWQSLYHDGNYWGVFGQQFDSSGAPQGDEFQVNIYTPFTQSHAVVSHASGRDFVVAWHSDRQDGSGFGVFARSFATGVATGSAARGASKLRTFRRD